MTVYYHPVIILQRIEITLGLSAHMHFIWLLQPQYLDVTPKDLKISLLQVLRTYWTSVVLVY